MRTIAEIEQTLQPYVAQAMATLGHGITTERTLRLSHHVGSPHERLKVVHVAGTSGKTSTSYYIRELLEAAGQKTGLTVSPHMMSITDRVQISGRPLDDKTFAAYFDEFFEQAKNASEMPTYFELLLVFALWVFDKEHVDYAVLETGLGGLHDSTNICRREDKLCVITDIGYDHQHVLGTTLPEISQQKAGIIAPNNTVVMYQQSSDVMDVVKKEATRQNAHLVMASRGSSVVKNGELPEYQKRNWGLAYTAYNVLKNRDDLPELPVEILQNTTLAQVPGRMEVFEVQGKKIILDGAHNEQKMRAFWRSFEQKYSGKKPLVIFGMKGEKELAEVVPYIVNHAGQVVVTSASITDDFGIGAGRPTEELREAFKNYIPFITVAPSPQVALKQALKTSNDMIVVTGSLYLVAEIRAHLIADML